MADQNFRVKNGLDVGIGGTIITTTGIGSVGIGSTQPGSTLVVNAPSGYSGNIINATRTGDAFSAFSVSRTGVSFRGNASGGLVSFVDYSQYYFYVGTDLQFFMGGHRFSLEDEGTYAWSSTTTAGQTADLTLYRDGANTLALRGGVNGGNTGAGQTFRIYNTYTSSTNFERAQVGWTTNTFIVGTEKGSAGGSPRQLELQTDGTTRVAITTDGYVGIGSTQPASTLTVDINQSSGTFTGNVVDVGYVDSTLVRRSIFQIAAQSFRYDTTNSGAKTAFRFGSFTSNTGWVGLHYGTHPNPVVYQTSLSTTTGVSGVNNTGYFAWTSGTYFTDYNSWDLRLYRDTSGVLAQRNGTNPNTFRVYNTYTSATNFERAQVGWTTDTFIVGTEKGVDGGTARQLELQTDGTTRVAITTTGLVGIGSTQPIATLDVNGDVNITGVVTATSASSSSNGMRKITTSTSAPTGGSDGDIWIQYIA